MTFTGVSADGGGSCFPQHPKTGPWESLKGGTLAPHMAAPMMSNAMGDSRHIDESPVIDWASTIIVSTGQTGPGGTMAK